MTKFKVRCSKYMYTFKMTDQQKAEKVKQSLPPGALSLSILPTFASPFCFAPPLFLLCISHCVLIRPHRHRDLSERPRRKQKNKQIRKKKTEIKMVNSRQDPESILLSRQDKVRRRFNRDQGTSCSQRCRGGSLRGAK